MDEPTNPPVALESPMAQFAALFIGIAILILGSGLLGTLLSVRGDIDGFSPELIGLVMSAYFVGFIGGAHYGPSVVARAGHIRSFTAMASIVSAASLVHAMLPEAWMWIGLRILTGFCFATLYLIAETWLNERSNVNNRGRVLSIYMMITFGGLLGGQFMLVIDDPSGFVLFGIASVAFSLSLVPIAMTRTDAPVPSSASRMSIPALFKLSPLGAVGCITSGLCLGSFWAIAPVFAREMGLDRGGIATFMAASILGGLFSQWPIGRMSDRHDRRAVIAISSGLAALCGAFIASMPASVAALLTASLLYGAFVFPLYPICLAHANDIRDTHDILSLGSGFLLLYGIGAAAGPLVGGFAFGAIGPEGLYAISAVFLAATAIYSPYRMLRRPSVPLDEKADFVAAPRTTPAAYDLDPRGAEPEEPPVETLPADEGRVSN